MIKLVSYNDFYINLSEDWKEIFIEEYKLYWNNLKLYWFYNKGEYLWWFCLWFNPDFFDNKDDENIIDNLLKEGYNKISYFSILDKYRWKKVWTKYLWDFLNINNDKYFLTCNWRKLKEYYISL